MASRWNAQYFKASELLDFVNAMLAEMSPGATATELKATDGDDFAFEGMVGNTPVVVAAKARAAAPGAMTIVGLAVLGPTGCMKWRADDDQSDGYLTLLTSRDRLFMSFGHVDDGQLSRVRDDFFQAWALRLPYGDAVETATLVGAPFSTELRALGRDRLMLPSNPRM